MSDFKDKTAASILLDLEQNTGIKDIFLKHGPASREKALRIVACLRAFHDMPTSAIESIPTPVSELARSYMAEIESLIGQRNELLALVELLMLIMLQCAEEASKADNHDATAEAALAAVRRAHEALAKAKAMSKEGGAA